MDNTREDIKKIRKMIADKSIVKNFEDEGLMRYLIDTYGETQTKNMIKEEGLQMEKELEAIFLFNIVQFDEIDYIPLDNIVSFLLKLEAYIDDFNIDDIKMNTIQISDHMYYRSDDLIELLDLLDPYVMKFDLKAVGDHIIEMSRENK